MDRVRAEVPETELQALVTRYVANIARGMGRGGAMLYALQSEQDTGE